MDTAQKDSPRERLFRLVSGYRWTQALYVAAKLGVADRLANGPMDAESLAREVGAHPQSLFRVLRALASIGVLSLDADRRFGLTPTGELLRSDVPGSLLGFATFSGEEPYRAFGELLHTVRTGQNAFRQVYGMGHFDYLSTHPEASATFHRTMASALEDTRDPLEGCDLRQRQLLVDVGGGQGKLIAGVLHHHPTLKGILFDLPNAVTGALAFLAASGLGERCEVRTGSAFESIPAGGDVYLMSRILHDWPDDEALRLLRNCRSAIVEGGTLILREAVLEEGTPSAAHAQLDLVMMAVPGGRERTEAEWRELLHRAGFALKRIVPGRGAQDTLEALAEASESA